VLFKVLQRVGSNTYVPGFSISSTFNIEDLVEYLRPQLIPNDHFETPPNHTHDNSLETPTLIPFVIGTA